MKLGWKKQLENLKHKVKHHGDKSEPNSGDAHIEDQREDSSQDLVGLLLSHVSEPMQARWRQLYQDDNWMQRELIRIADFLGRTGQEPRNMETFIGGWLESEWANRSPIPPLRRSEETK